MERGYRHVEAHGFLHIDDAEALTFIEEPDPEGVVGDRRVHADLSELRGEALIEALCQLPSGVCLSLSASAFEDPELPRFLGGRSSEGLSLQIRGHFDRELASRVALIEGGPLYLQLMLVSPAGLSTLAQQAKSPIAGLDLGESYRGAILETLPAIEGLEQLVFCGTRIDEPVLDAIRRMTGLRALWLDDPCVREPDLSSLALLPRLERLSIAYSELSARSLSVLGRLPGLRALDLYRSRLGPGALEHVAAATSLCSLRLERVDLERSALPQLASLPGLTALDLGQATGLDDRSLGAFSLELLEGLSIELTGVSDASVERLAALPGLRVLSIWGNKITPAGETRLRAAHPDCLFVE